MTITEFLNARYDEEEAVARRQTFDNPTNPRMWNGPGQYPTMTGKSLLADIAAKRAIVALFLEIESYIRIAPDGPGALLGAQMSVAPLRQVLNIQVQPYAEHADFDPAWRT